MMMRNIWFFALLLIQSSVGIAKDVPTYRVAKLLALRGETVQKTQFIGQPFGDVHFMTSRPYRAILYNMTIELGNARYVLNYEAKSRKDDLPQLRVGDSLDVRLDKNGKTMFIRRAGGKDFKTKIIQQEKMASPEIVSTPIE